jgi:hypothetical protein
MTKNRRRVIKHTILAAAICLVMGMGIVSFADDKGTVIPASAKIRASADASSTQVGSVAQGGNVDIIGKTTGSDGNTWYQVYVDANTKGYIRADLVKVAGTGTISEVTSDTSTTTTASTTDQSVTEATAVDAKTCTVSQNSARIRKGASTNHDIVATANKGMTLTITGEANGSDGKLWYQVSFTYNNKEVTGFIRSDLVTFDSVTSDAAVSEIQGEAGEEANVEQETAEAVENQEESDSSQNSYQGIVLMNVDETPYILPGFSAVSLSWNDESIKAYSNGGFYLFYAQMANGDEGWYIFDSEKGEYQRYVYTASDTATIPKSTDSVGIIPVIVLVIIIIILAAVIGILIIKLRDASYSYEYEDDEQEEDDVEDLEFEEIQPRRQSAQGQAQRRQGQMPQSQMSQGQRQQTAQGQAQRRQGQMPQGQQTAQGQAQRRQVSSQGQQTAQGQQAQRRQVSSQGQQTAQGQAQRRQGQMPQGQQSAQGQAQRRQGQMPQGQQAQGRANSNVQRQRTAANPDSAQGYKAKTILDNNDDMDFIDV